MPCIEEWFRSLNAENVGCTISFGKRSLERAVVEYAEQYHIEQNSKGLYDGLIESGDEIGHAVDVVEYAATEIALALTPVCEGNRQVRKRKHGRHSQGHQSIRP